MDQVIDKILSNMDRELLTLEIQVAQIRSDPACRGSMVAVEALRKELEILKDKLEG